jgi:hypothetical protein
MFLAPVIFLAASAPLQPAPRTTSVYIEQINIAALRKIEATRQIPTKRQDQRRVAFNQLPSNLEQAKDAKEDELVSKTTPEANLTADVLRAWNQIRNRGQTPTPDLVAREIGPDRLAEFLATSPAAASVLATGNLPDPPNGGEQPSAPPGEGK